MTNIIINKSINGLGEKFGANTMLIILSYGYLDLYHSHKKVLLKCKSGSNFHI